MKNLNEKNAAQILKDLHEPGTLVDNHQFEREAMQQFTTEFALDFLEYIDQPDPLLSFSLNFGRWIQRELELKGHIARTRRVPSLNLRGGTTENQQWQIV